MAILIHTSRTPREKANIPMFNGTYMGEELRPFEGRRSAMQAHALPSRRGDALRWPDGRMTDLCGSAYVEQETTATLPAFPGRVRGGNKPLDAAPYRGPNLEDWGKKNALAKLDAAKVREIRAKRDAGIELLQIAAEYDVHVNTIKSIFAGKTWKEVK